MTSPITRRTALRTIASAATLAALPRSAGAADAPQPASTPSPMPDSASSSPLRQSVCRWCFRDTPLDELCRRAKELGLQSVELLQPDEWPVAIQHGLTCAMAMGHSTIPEGFNRIEHHEKLVPQFIERIQAVAAAKIPNLICFSGNRRGLDDPTGLENCAVGLRQIMPEAERAGVTICMELLNSRVNHKDYMCDRTPWGVELVQKVGSPRFKLLYDIYHMQIMEGDVIRTIRDNREHIAHFHTAGVPGRHEIDGSQELNYPAVMRAIADTGFSGYVAQEFIPTRDPWASLEEAVKLCRV